LVGCSWFALLHAGHPVALLRVHAVIANIKDAQSVTNTAFLVVFIRVLFVDNK